MLLLFLPACGEREGLAPVVELKWQSVKENPKTHVVVRGETLYAIAFRYDQDYRQLSVINHLRSPYTLRVGQVLRLQPDKPLYRSPTSAKIPSHSKTISRPPAPKIAKSTKSLPNRWLWPVRGKIVNRFAPTKGKKGIDIVGKKGEKIRAASSGMVAYAGDGLPGYGNLIIIKHNRQYLTAYGNNLRNLVKEGQPVKAGQVIAEMGSIDRRHWGVHFEIRKAGKPVNPLNYL